jgi:hypothetical protein
MVVKLLLTLLMVQEKQLLDPDQDIVAQQIVFSSLTLIVNPK